MNLYLMPERDLNSSLDNVLVIGYQYDLIPTNMSPSSTLNMLDASSGEALLSRSYKDVYNMIWSIITSNRQIGPCEHVTFINMQMGIIGTPDSLKCKLLSRTFSEAALRWYTGFPRSSINSYRELARKLVHQFAVSHHRKISTTSLFNIHQGPSELMRDYLAHFNGDIVKVVLSNHEMFVGAFLIWLWTRHFNESLSPKPTFTLTKVVARAECYIKGE